MKKSLSVLLSVAMMFSVFASFAFGQEAAQTTEDKYQQLVEQGIFTGMPDGGAHLDADMTRAQFATVLLRLFELNENVAASNVYNDLDGAGWAAGAVGAATQAGLMQGRGEGVFDPSGSVTVQELAIVLTRAFQLQPSNETIPGIVDDWAKGEVAAAIKAGLITAKANYTAPALRGDLVDSSYTAQQTIASLTEPEVAFSATKATELQVKFSRAVDTSKVEFDVNYGGATITPESVTWSADNTTATIEFSSRMQQGVYNISVTGATANAVEGSVNIQDEQVARIEIMGDTGAAILDKNNNNKLVGVNVHYIVFNQYNEDVTRTSSVSFQSSLGATDPNPQKGTIEITISNPDSYLPYGTQFNITGYISGTAVSVNKMMKLGDEARANTINVLGLYHHQDKKLNVGMDRSEYLNFALLLEVKDQYGNIMEDTDVLKEQITGFSNNLTLADIARYNSDDHDPSEDHNKIKFQDNLGENNDQIGVTLDKRSDNFVVGLSGTVTVTLNPIFGGTQATYSFDVGSAAVASTIQLSQPSTVVTIGETVTIPYRALDRNGQEVTDFKALTEGNAKLNLTAAAGELKFVENLVTGKAELKFNTNGITTTGQYFISAYTNTGGSSQITVNVRDSKVPASVVGVKSDVRTAMLKAEGTLAAGTTKIKAEDIILRDQYGNNLNIFGKMNDMNYADQGYVIELRLSERLQDNVSLAGSNHDLGVVESVYSVYLSEKEHYALITGGESDITANLEILVKQKVNGELKDVELTGTYGNTTNYTQNGSRNISLSVISLANISDFGVEELERPLYTDRNAGAANTLPNSTHNGSSAANAWYRDAQGAEPQEIIVYGVAGNRKVALPNSPQLYTIAVAERGIKLDGTGDNWTIVVEAHTLQAGPTIVTGSNQTQDLALNIIAIDHEGKSQTVPATVKITNAKPEIATIVADAEVELGQGPTVGAILNEIEITDNHGLEWPNSAKTGTIIITDVKDGTVTSTRISATGSNLNTSIGASNGASFKVTFVSETGKVVTFVAKVAN